MAKTHVTALINGDPSEFLCEPGDTLLDVLRNELQLTGTKEGCGSGDCGAYSVTLNDRLVCACLVLGVEVEVMEVRTATEDELAHGHAHGPGGHHHHDHEHSHDEAEKGGCGNDGCC